MAASPAGDSCYRCDCTEFEPNLWNPSRCTNCFHTHHLMDNRNFFEIVENDRSQTIHNHGTQFEVDQTKNDAQAPVETNQESVHTIATDGSFESTEHEKVREGMDLDTAATIIQKRFRRKKFGQLVNKTVRMFQERTSLATELLQTEETYVSSLKEMIQCFQQPLMENNYLSHTELIALFPHIQTLYQLHSTLLDHLREKMTDWTSRKKIGDIFLELAPFMKMYSLYLKDFSPDTVANLTKKHKRFNKWLKEKHSPNGLGSGELYLNSLLIMPIQRIPRYELLLKALVRFTPQDHEDYQDLKSSLEEIVKVANLMNTNHEKEISQKTLHTFSRVHFASPTWCDYCEEFIWGMNKQGYWCSVCGYNAHKRCIGMSDIASCKSGVEDTNDSIKNKVEDARRSARRLARSFSKLQQRVKPEFVEPF